MLGNVYQWCQGSMGNYTPTHSDVPLEDVEDKRDAAYGLFRAYRGRGFNELLRNVRSAYRAQDRPTFGGAAGGFRVARTYCPPNISASHCYSNDKVHAVADGIVPKNSDDHTIPRFTWWNHQGTKEWIQREFAGPRRVSKVDVYWFDDAPHGGGCRTPQSWRLLYRKSGMWQEVTGASEFGLTTDQFNETTFDPVVTDALRIEVQLRDGYSAGILEWRMPALGES
jgi:hypothetical protein